MIKIVKCDLKRLLRNPLYYIGFIIITINIGLCCNNYFHIHYYNDEYEPVELSERVELDIYKGYLPPKNEKEKLEIGLSEYKKLMIQDGVMTEEEVNANLDYIESKNLSIEETLNYLNQNDNVHISSDLFSDQNCLKAGNSNELNAYIKEKNTKENYTAYLARKFVDYLGIHVIFLCSILLIFLTIDDFAKNTYELLHTKINSSVEYIMAKFLTGFLSLVLFVIVIGLVFDLAGCIYGAKEGFSVNFLDIWKYVFLCTIPSLIFAVSFYIFITCVFKNTIVALPLMLLLIFYANQGISEAGTYVYKHRLFQITPRFPGLFFETGIDNILVINQILLIIIAVILLGISCVVWESNLVNSQEVF